MTEEAFVDTLGDIFEHSPWIAKKAFKGKPFDSAAQLHEAMTQVVQDAPEDAQLELIRAHPDLAGKAAIAGTLTASSTSEQAGAGLDTLSENEYKRFHKLNSDYKERFDFPFILAVKGHDKRSILAQFEQRLEHSRDEELATALDQISRIALLRLGALFDMPIEALSHE